MSGKKYIYNHQLANFMMEQGVVCKGTGVAISNNRVYWVFNYDECQDAYEKWNNRDK